MDRVFNEGKGEKISNFNVNQWYNHNQPMPKVSQYIPFQNSLKILKNSFSNTPYKKGHRLDLAHGS